jgi:hypothetical protein
VYQRASDGKWRASVLLDHAKRRVISGKTRNEVAQKLNEAMQEFHSAPIGSRLAPGWPRW